MLNCDLKNGLYYFWKPDYDLVNKIIRWKRSHFKVGDKYRVKFKSGHIEEFEIQRIHDNGCVEVRGFHSINVHGKPVISESLSSFWVDTMFVDLQERGCKFHKIKKFSKKYGKIKVICDNWWNKDE